MKDDMFIFVLAACTLTGIVTWACVRAWYDYKYDNLKKTMRTLQELVEAVEKLGPQFEQGRIPTNLMDEKKKAPLKEPNSP